MWISFALFYLYETYGFFISQTIFSPLSFELLVNVGVLEEGLAKSAPGALSVYVTLSSQFEVLNMHIMLF